MRLRRFAPLVVLLAVPLAGAEPEKSVPPEASVDTAPDDFLEEVELLISDAERQVAALP